MSNGSATKTPPAPNTGTGAVRVSKVEFEKVKYVPVDLPKESLYLIGVVDGAPFHNADLAGIAFPQIIEDIKFDRNNRTVRIEQRGQMIHLTKDKVEAIKKASLYKLVRWMNKEKTKADIVSSKSIGFRADVRDEPVAMFIYMRKIFDQMPNEWRDLPQEPMAQL